jgi:hypothetical protein
MQFRGEMSNRQRPVDSQLPYDSQGPFDRQDAYAGERHGKRNDLADSAVLARLIRCEFRKGDPIGITFEDLPFLFVGIFKDIVGDVLVIKDLFLEDTISFVPLDELSSVTAGICPRYIPEGPMAIIDRRE